MTTDHWQQAAIEWLVENLQSNYDILALGIMGSALHPERMDQWSDLDLLLVVWPDSISDFAEKFPHLYFFGDPFGVERHANEYVSVLRIALANGRRIDVVITTEESLIHLDRWSNNPFRSGVQILYSRSQIVADVLTRKLDPSPPPSHTPEQFDAMVDAFWFRGMVAVQKVARGDLLIGAHLAFEMAQDCLVLAMILRDRAEGTTIHKTGGAWNEITRNFGAIAAASADDILRLIKRCAHTFDDLAGQWSTDYVPRKEHLLALIEKASRGG